LRTSTGLTLRFGHTDPHHVYSREDREMSVFEIIGVIFVWAVGFGLAFYAPVFAVPLIWSTGDGLSDLVIGVFWGKVIAVIYVIGTVAWLAAT